MHRFKFSLAFLLLHGNLGCSSDDDSIEVDTLCDSTNGELCCEDTNTSDCPPETTPQPEPLPEPVLGSCARKPAGTTLISSSNAIKNNGEDFFDNAGPQCVVPDNQFNGPGLRYGDFLLSNNAWNGQNSSADWLQCIALNQIGESVIPSWNYDWGNEDDLVEGNEEWTVKSYPEIIYGAKSQNNISGGCEDVGLPAPYAQLPEFTIDFEYTTTDGNNYVGDAYVPNENGDFQNISVTNGDRNVAIESFFHTDCEIKRGGEDGNVEFELMVWLEKGNERRPSGDPPVGTFTDSENHVFDIYTKPTGNDAYVAYVAQNAIASGKLHWNEFIEDLRLNGANYGDEEGNLIRTFNDAWCMGNILFGTEIWWGDGSMEISDYKITRRY